MTKATYRAPKDDSPVVFMRGVRFIDGDPVKLGDEHAALIAKLRTNPLFEVTGEAKKAAEAVEEAEAAPEPTDDFGQSESE